MILLAFSCFSFDGATVGERGGEISRNEINGGIGGID